MGKEWDVQRMKYMIHSVPERMWYVDNYLIPSLLEQGVLIDDIQVYTDEKRQGNLFSCIESFRLCTKNENTWHLQDDVVIAEDFGQRTTELEQVDGIMCGFCSYYDRDNKDKVGKVTPEQMWYSFPCIRIPNALAKEFVEWYDNEVVGEMEFNKWIIDRKHDDQLFRCFVQRKHSQERIVNLNLNLVDHIDYLIGGSTTNQQRSEHARALYFDNKVVKELEVKLWHNEK